MGITYLQLRHGDHGRRRTTESDELQLVAELEQVRGSLLRTEADAAARGRRAGPGHCGSVSAG
jgi:hypothetical protein